MRSRCSPAALRSDALGWLPLWLCRGCRTRLMAHPGRSGAGPIVRTTTAQSSHATFDTQGCVQAGVAEITLLKETTADWQLIACGYRKRRRLATVPGLEKALLPRRQWLCMARM